MTSPAPPFSETIVYVDESGDHGTATIDPGFPIFVLLFAVFHKPTYINRFVPAIGNLKFRLFGHDGVILHERDIRKDTGAFALLREREKKEQFFEEVNEIVARTPFEGGRRRARQTQADARWRSRAPLSRRSALRPRAHLRVPASRQPARGHDACRL